MAYPVECWLEVDGQHFADTAADFYGAEPTALADLKVTWGRNTVVDQPEAATCSVKLVDPPGGPSFLDVVEIGDPLVVHARGVTSEGGATNVNVDPSFEALALGNAGARVLQGPADVVNTTASDGVQSLNVADGAVMWLTVGPDTFGIEGAPQSWDDIPPFRTGEHWTYRVAHRAGRDTFIEVWTMLLDGPRNDDPAAYYYVWDDVWGDLAWRTVTHEFASMAASAEGKWPGIRFRFTALRWDGVVPGITPPKPLGPWSDTPGTWNEYRINAYVDLVEFISYSPALRDVLVFSGEVTDLRARSSAADGRVEIDVTAIDQLGDLANRFIGDVPWPMETVAQRIARIVAGQNVTVLNLPTSLSGLSVSRRDVDRQAVADLLQALAAGIDGVLWSATHSTTGPYLWLEDPQRRISVGVLAEDPEGLVVVVGGDVEGGDRTLDACWLNGDVEWVRDVSDVITRVDATWLDQTGDPEPVERWIPTVVDVEAEGDHGARHMSVSTPLTKEADAIEVARRTFTRTRQLQWRAEEVVWPLDRIGPLDTDQVGVALDLLDGTIRLGRGLLIDGIANAPVGPTLGMYLDGGDYDFDQDGWTLTLRTSARAGFGQSVPWEDLGPLPTPAGTPNAWVTMPTTADNLLMSPLVSTAIGDLFITARIKLDGVTSGANRTIAEQWRRVSSGVSRWIFRIDTAGKPVLLWSQGGVTKTITSTAALPSSVTSWLWVRVSLDAYDLIANHVVKFETSVDLKTWTTLSTVTTPGVAQIDAGSTRITIGGARGSTLGLAGSVSDIVIRNAVETVLEMHCYYDLANVPANALSFYCHSGQLLDVVRSGSPGIVLTPPATPPPPGEAWAWNEFHPDVAWDELWGVTAPGGNY